MLKIGSQSWLWASRTLRYGFTSYPEALPLFSSTAIPDRPQPSRQVTIGQERRLVCLLTATSPPSYDESDYQKCCAMCSLASKPSISALASALAPKSHRVPFASALSIQDANDGNSIKHSSQPNMFRVDSKNIR